VLGKQLWLQFKPTSPTDNIAPPHNLSHRIHYCMPVAAAMYSQVHWRTSTTCLRSPAAWCTTAVQQHAWLYIQHIPCGHMHTTPTKLPVIQTSRAAQSSTPHICHAPDPSFVKTHSWLTCSSCCSRPAPTTSLPDTCLPHWHSTARTPQPAPPHHHSIHTSHAILLLTHTETLPASPDGQPCPQSPCSS
jgi:hypothetical protein